MSRPPLLSLDRGAPHDTATTAPSSHAYRLLHSLVLGGEPPSVRAVQSADELRYRRLSAIASLDLQAFMDVASVGAFGLETRATDLWHRTLWLSRPSLAEVDELIAQARESGDAQLTIEATVLSYLVADLSGSPDALERARRAMRMARTEGLRTQLFLSAWALARGRRKENRHALGYHIVSVAFDAAPNIWNRLLGWERSICSGIPVEQHTGLPLAWDVERGAWRTCVGLEGEAVDPALAWTSGRVATVPYGLGASQHSGHHAACLHVSTRSPTRRLFAKTEPSHDGGSPRVLALLAHLAWHKEGVEIPHVFQRVYGFAYEPAHQTVLRTLLRRAREMIAPHEIERTRDQLVLLVSGDLLLPDPDSRVTLENQIIRALASGTDEVVAIARECRVSRRTVQRALHQLSEDGAVASSRTKNSVRYRLEDTTFEPWTELGSREPS